MSSSLAQCGHIRARLRGACTAGRFRVLASFAVWTKTARHDPSHRCSHNSMTLSDAPQTHEALGTGLASKYGTSLPEAAQLHSSFRKVIPPVPSTHSPARLTIDQRPFVPSGAVRRIMMAGSAWPLITNIQENILCYVSVRDGFGFWNISRRSSTSNCPRCRRSTSSASSSIATTTPSFSPRRVCR